MPDDKVVTPDPDKYNYKDDHFKSINVIARELRDQRRKEPEVEVVATEEKTPIVEVKPEVKEESKPEVKEPEVTITVDDITKQAAALARDELKEEFKKIEDSKLTKEEKKDAKETAKWQWEDENRNPKDYSEIASAAEERALDKAKEWFKEQQEQERTTRDNATKAEQEKADLVRKTQEDSQKHIESRVNAEIDKLFDGGHLQKPVDINATDDPAAKEYRDFLNAAIKYNEEHKDTPIGSPVEFFFMHYKPKGNQPAGNDAPIAGNRTTVKPADTDDKFVYARDSRKSFRQLLLEARENLKR